MYKNGSDLLLKVADGCIGHCTTHEATYSTETKDTAYKPVATQSASTASLWKGKRVTGLSMQVTFEGLKFSGETESGFKTLLGGFRVGSSVAVKLFERAHDTTPYASGNFIIASLKETNPAGEDSTYSGTLENDGAIDIDESKIDITGGGNGGGVS